MKYKEFLKDVVIEARKAMEKKVGDTFCAYDFACCVMDAVYADFTATVKTDAEAVEILNGIGFAKLYDFYHASKDVYTSVYQVAENPSNSVLPVDIIINPLKFVSEMSGMVACEIAFFAEGYGTDEQDERVKEILTKFDSDSGDKITKEDIRIVISRTMIGKLTENCKLVKALA